MLLDIYALILAAAKLRSFPQYPSRWAVWFAFARIRLKLRWLAWTGRAKNSEKFLGMTAHFFDYATFAYLFEEIFVQGTYAFETAHNNPVVVDAGSNVGLSVLFTKWLYPKARIRAFEPDPRTFAILRKNIVENDLQDVVLYNFALSGTEGLADFHSNGGGSLSASLLAERVASANANAVHTRRLSSFLDPQVDFLKMDIEGAEADCLREIADFGNLQNIREMVIECHHNLPGRERILTEVLPVLETHGFRFQIRGSSAVSRVPQGSTQDVILHVFQPPVPHVVL